MDAEQLEQALDGIAEVHETALTGDVSEVLDVVAHVACRLLERCEAASVTVFADGAATTVAFQGSVSLDLDEVQYKTDSGPCLDSARTRQLVVAHGLTERSRAWPEFVAAAVGHGIAGAVAAPIPIDDRLHAALNLYAAEAEGLRDDEPIAVRLAGAASVALRGALARLQADEQAEQLRAAIRSRDLIGQAKGILMHSQRLDEAAAFELLRRESQRRNVSVRALAEQVAYTGVLEG